MLVVGAGFAGVVAAEQLSKTLGWHCVVVDQRDHIGGNSYDRVDENGVLIHPYGPHYFRSNSQKIVDYLGQFTDWHPVNYKVQSFTQGRYWSFPVNLKTFEQIIGKPATTEQFEAWLEKERIPIEQPANSEEVILSQVGYDLYEKFFKGYTIKQWKRHPRELDASVCGRIPIRTDRNDNYLKEEFQALPKEGFTKMFEAILASCDTVDVELNTSYVEAKERYNYRHLIYTGSIDSYFEQKFGALPYRSLRFEHEHFDAESLKQREEIAGKAGFWQPEMQVNYPEETVDFTRIVEIKHATGQEIAGTTIVREFPADFEETGEPFYPVPNDASREIYQKYKQAAEQQEGVTFIGRLGTYRYYNMDQVVGMALAAASKLIEQYQDQEDCTHG